MNKYPILLFTILITSTCLFARQDFIFTGGEIRPQNHVDITKNRSVDFVVLYRTMAMGSAPFNTFGQFTFLTKDGMNHTFLIDNSRLETRLESKITLWLQHPLLLNMSCNVPDGTSATGRFRISAIGNIPTNLPIGGCAITQLASSFPSP